MTKEKITYLKFAIERSKESFEKGFFPAVKRQCLLNILKATKII